MKRLTAILLALIYISTTSGIVINTHYCMGKIAEIALGASGQDKCNTCGMENEGCCHDDLQVIKLTENHHFSAVHFELPAIHDVAPAYNSQEENEIPFGIASGSLRNHSPPNAVSRNVLYCVYRI
ncbi:MAG TPA: hypothetical protein VLA58_01580 [Chitinophagaceae bacterium]|nr:hypothetical protein [Chitinophagaceae bacterium]